MTELPIAFKTVTLKTDLCVVGGGLSGLSAAVAAAPDSMVVGLSTGSTYDSELKETVSDTTTIADWRRMMRKAVKRMKDAGDDKVFAIEGPDVATFADLSTDGVHLDSAGADAVAKRLIERLSL